MARSGKLRDPVKIDSLKAADESSMLNSTKVPPAKQRLGKETLPVELWASGKIEATPYGTFARMMGGKEGSADSERSAKKNATMESHVVFDHFSYPHGKAAIDLEMPRGKRIHPQTIYANPSNAFGRLPQSVEREIAQIQPPESLSWANS